MMRAVIVTALSLFLSVTALEAAGKKKKNKIVWVKAEINTEQTRAKRSLRSDTFKPVLRDVQYEYGLEVLLSENAKSRMPKDFNKFLEAEGAPVSTQRSIRQIRKEVVGSRQSRLVDQKSYYACSYEASNLVCIRDGFSFPEHDVKNILPEAFTRYLYTGDQLEDIQNFYFID